MQTVPTPQEIAAFLAEDIGSGDLTSAIIPTQIRASASIFTRETMVLCGQRWLEAIFQQLDASISIYWLTNEGDKAEPDTVLCRLHGPAHAILTGERTALNILQTLSATATVSRGYAEAIAGLDCKILDTRKTIPGLRLAQKYAVQCGGCHNHRIGLFDAVLIKENHIMAAGSIAKAIAKARELTDKLVEIEVENLAEFHIASVAKPDRIMLDNFSLTDLRSAVNSNHGTIELEASGDITLENIRSIAETGVNFISIGALTKNIRAINLSMRIELENT